MKAAVAVVVVSIVAGTALANCGLNPQPFPPSSGGSDNGASFGGSSSSGSSGGSISARQDGGAADATSDGRPEGATGGERAADASPPLDLEGGDALSDSGAEGGTIRADGAGGDSGGKADASADDTRDGWNE
jgi:hypothetical protein